jgi:hypothetical protein
MPANRALPLNHEARIIPAAPLVWVTWEGSFADDDVGLGLALAVGVKAGDFDGVNGVGLSSKSSENDGMPDGWLEALTVGSLDANTVGNREADAVGVTDAGAGAIHKPTIDPTALPAVSGTNSCSTIMVEEGERKAHDENDCCKKIG